MEVKNEDRRYYELAEKWLEGTITPAEEQEFSDWYNKGQDAPVAIPAFLAATEQELKDRIWANIQQGKKRKQATLFRIVRYAAAAAIILLLAGAGWWGWMTTEKKPEAVAVKPVAPPQQHDILPGSNKAVLTLADGAQINLDDAQKGTLSKQGTTDVVKLANGQVAYQAGAPVEEVKYNTLSTPRGGQYQLTLPDGTTVWLNASSSIHFPTAFRGKERRVELRGEAYFEVAKNPDMPFKVSVNDMEVSVLGTHFNVMAYDNEGAAKTTLVEGSVRVNRGADAVVITPGQQAQVGAGSAIRVVPHADVEEALAWKNGYFQFNGARIESVMRQVERWYDVDVVYAGTIDEQFYGMISRNVEVSKVFKMLELTGAVHFKIDGRRVIVSP